MENKNYAPGVLSQLIKQKTTKICESEIGPKKKLKTDYQAVDKQISDTTANAKSKNSLLESIFDCDKAKQFAVAVERSAAEAAAASLVESSRTTHCEVSHTHGDEDDADVHSTEDHKRELQRERSRRAKAVAKERKEFENSTVFVGNLPTTVEKKDMLKLFKECGKIKSVRFRSVMRKDLKLPLKASTIKKDFHPNSKNLNAYIVFEDDLSAQKALERNGSNYKGNCIRVDLCASSSKEPNRKSSVFVGSVPFDAHEDELRSHFSDCGDIVNVRIIRDRVSRIGKGFGYIEFQTPDSVALALQLDGRPFQKHKLRVQRCVKKEKPINPQAKARVSTGQVQSWQGTTADRNQKPKILTKPNKKKQASKKKSKA